MNKLFLILISISVLLVSASPILAIDAAPNFPSCVNPQGQLKVRYENGKHAVIGRSNLISGKDEVYWLDNGNLLQCLCEENGEGTQTNWWKVTGITQEEINAYKSQGWIFVPTGSDWGLISDPYLAKNFTYGCKGNDGGSGGGDSGIGGGGTSSVLGLAQTGNNATYVALFSLGISFVLGGVLLRRKRHASDRV